MNNIERLREGKEKSTLDKLWNFEGVNESFKSRIHRGIYESSQIIGKDFMLKERGNAYQPVSKTVYDYFNKVKDRYVIPTTIELPDMSEYLCYVDKFLIAQIKKDFEGYELSVEDLDYYLSETNDIKIPRDKAQRKEYVTLVMNML